MGRVKGDLLLSLFRGTPMVNIHITEEPHIQAAVLSWSTVWTTSAA